MKTFFFQLMSMAKQNPVQLGIYETLMTELGLDEGGLVTAIFP